MKCPFITKIVKRVEPKFDENGNRIGEEIIEEIERADCLKGDCVIFSTDKNQCSFVAVQEMVMAMEGLAARSVDNLVNRYEGIIRERLDTIKSEIADVLNSLNEEFRKADERIYTLQKVGFEKILSFVSGGYENTKTITLRFDDLKEAIAEMGRSQSQAIEGISNRINELLGRLTEQLSSLLRETNQGLSSGLESLKSKFGDEMNRLLDSESRFQEQTVRALDDLSTRISRELGNRLAQDLNRLIEVEHQLRNELTSSLSQVVSRIDGLKEEMNQYLKQQEERINQLLATEKSYRENSAQRLEGLFTSFRDSLEGAIGTMKSEISTQIEKITEFGRSYQSWFEDANRSFREGLESAVGGLRSEISAQIEKLGQFERRHQEWMESVLKEIRGFFESEREFLKEERKRRQLEEADRLNELAIVDYHRGNYEAALTSVRKALELSEKAEYYANLGMIYTEMNEFDEAKKAFSKALELNPDSAEIYNNLGVLNFRIKDYEQAVNAFNEAIKRRKNYAQAYLHLGKALLELERFDEAIRTFETVLEIDPENSEAEKLLKMYKEGRIDGHTEEA